MNQNKVNSTILAELAAVYPDAECELIFKNPFELLVATILSAQCTDKQVNKVTPSLFAVYPDAFSLANAELINVENIIKSTGFYRRKAKLLINMSQELAERYEGRVPDSMDKLVKLAGVGRKTANVVLGNAFAVPGLTIDTHFSRFAHRIGWSKASSPEKIETDVANVVSQPDWTETSHRVIAHGRSVCHARKPACGSCFLFPLCPSFGIGETDFSKAIKLVKGPWKTNVLKEFKIVTGQ